MEYIQVLRSVGELKGMNFAYAVHRNLITLKAPGAAFNESVAALKKSFEYKEGEKPSDDCQSALDALLKEEVGFKPFMIAFASVPEDITGNQMHGIMFMVEGQPA